MLKQELAVSKKSGYAEGTSINLRIQWKSFLLFCFHFKLLPVPVSTETLSLYAQFLSRSFASTDSIRNYVSGVRTMHLLLGVDLKINDFLLNLGLKGINRLHPHCVKQALPITPRILKDMRHLLNLSTPIDATFWCLCLFAFFLLARKSNLVLNNKNDSSKRYFLRSDVTQNGDTLFVAFRWSKTLQFGERQLIIPLVRSSSDLCPVSAFELMLRLCPVSPEKPLFSWSSGCAFTYSAFQSKLKFLIKSLGLNSDNYSTHSFRRGGATLAFQAGISSELIQLQGDWRSDAYKKYLTFSINDKVQVAQQMNAFLLSRPLTDSAI
ncbi:MAG: hypothetical protein ABW185_13485 [Sedimenticola sp.]